MGYYVNPPNQTKEAWLRDNGFEMPSPGSPIAACDAMVCLIDNGFMTAAGIAYCDGELDQFASPDGRPKRWFAVSKAKLVEVCPDVAREWG